jgi:hypothetical protein
VVETEVFTVSVPAADAEPVIFRLEGTAHVAGLTADDGSVLTAQVRLIDPMKLLVGEAVMVAVFAVLAPAAKEMEPLLPRVNFDGLTLTTMVDVDAV